MASKENQEALDTIYKKCNGDTDIIESLLTLQKAIDNEEFYKKALEIACESITKSTIEKVDSECHYMQFKLLERDFMQKCIRQARKELLSGK